MGGWLSIQENFILSVRAICNLNIRCTRYTCGTDLAKTEGMSTLPKNARKNCNDYLREQPDANADGIIAKILLIRGGFWGERGLLGREMV